MVLTVLRDAEVDAGDRCIELRLSVSSQMAQQAADSCVGQWEFANYKVTLPEARTRTLVFTPLGRIVPLTFLSRMRLSFCSVVCLVLALLLGELEDRGGLTPADDLCYSLLDEVADLCPAGDPGSSWLDEEASC
jgi:hypothetical protein